ncbi:Inositol-trisphosphate 3-kinase B [Hypsibius exemplaris]|uniref:Kinase n=1 Tax=Hypsibius exemplaris TaxID=2072580 RepID=A0A9X6RLG7_HYPEX|nr:Inositol-trisphosphate 3-kinase B [Hypsibius exemplaris]
MIRTDLRCMSVSFLFRSRTYTEYSTIGGLTSRCTLAAACQSSKTSLQQVAHAMEAVMQRLRKNKMKDPRERTPPGRPNWRVWFKSPKDSARDLLPCFRRQASTYGAPSLVHLPASGDNAANAEGDPATTVEPIIAMEQSDISKPSARVNLCPVLSAPAIVTPDIVIAEDADSSASSPGHDAGGKEDQSQMGSGGFLEVGYRTPLGGSSSPQPSPSHSKSSLNQLFPFPGDIAHAFIRRFSVGSAGRKLGLAGSQRAKYHWMLIRQYICFSFAIRGDRRMPWVQLAGHEGSFQTGECGTVLKKLSPEEKHSLEALMDDVVKPFAPSYMGTREIDGQDYIEMRDLLTGFDTAVSVMDCKLGIRTYLEEELTKAKAKPTMRPDMYTKMIEVDANEPTAEEHAQQAVTKPRYMQWRETISSTATLGFRVEGVKKPNGFSSKDYKFTKRKEDVVEVFKHFTDCNPDIIQIYIHRLKDLRKAVAVSPFFASHEVIGSSLLLIHDTAGLAGVWMIDFAKTVPLPENIHIDHFRPWVEGNHEDGYLIGLNNLIGCFEEILRQKSATFTDR